MVVVGLTILKPSFSISSHLLPPHSFPFPNSLTFKPKPFNISQKSHLFPLFASSNNNNEVKEQEKSKEQEQPSSSSSSSSDSNGQQQKKPFFSFNWSTLLDPDPDNVLALGLTGLLTWASVQVLWQLLFISFAILVAALKYSFIAALLIFILIALL